MGGDAVKSFGKVMRVHREKLELTQEELAAAVGVCRLTIQQTELYDKGMRFQTALKAIKYLGIPFAEVMECVPGELYDCRALKVARINEAIARLTAKRDEL